MSWFFNPWVMLGIPAMLYAVQSMRYYFGMRRIGMCIAFAGYVLGNIGFIIDEYEQRVDDA